MRGRWADEAQCHQECRWSRSQECLDQLKLLTRTAHSGSDPIDTYNQAHICIDTIRLLACDRTRRHRCDLEAGVETIPNHRCDARVTAAADTTVACRAARKMVMCHQIQLRARRRGTRPASSDWSRQRAWGAAKRVQTPLASSPALHPPCCQSSSERWQQARSRTYRSGELEVSIK